MSGWRPEAPAACGALASSPPCLVEDAGEDRGEGAGPAGAPVVAFAAPPVSGEGAEPSASRVRLKAPSDTSSPTFTFTSLTTPAALEGTSMVALSDSSVIRLCSFSTRSPAFTSTSITGTLSWPPMSGTFTSIVFAMSAPPSEQQPADVAELVGEEGGKARGERAVDHAVVIGERQRQHQPRRELLAVPHRLHLRLGNAQDGDFRRVDDRRERGAADAAQRGDREAAAGHLGRAELLLARLLGDFAELAGEVE